MGDEATLWTILVLYLLVAGLIGGLLPTWPLSVAAIAVFACILTVGVGQRARSKLGLGAVGDRDWRFCRSAIASLQARSENLWRAKAN